MNLLVCWSRALGLLGLLLPLSLLTPSTLFRCLATHLLLPLLLLHEKICLTASVLLRYSYIYHPTLFTSTHSTLLLLTFSSLLLLLLALPFLTLLHHQPQLLRTCLLLPPSPHLSSTFLLLYLATWLATLLLDIFCYARIINFMRVAAVRISVVPDTEGERKRVVNLVTGSSSLLVWLVSLGAMLPSLLLTHQPPGPGGEARAATHYHLLAIGGLNTVRLLGWIQLRTRVMRVMDYRFNTIEH